MSASGKSFRPPVPTPQPKPLGAFALLKTLRRNPLECWTKAHFEELIVFGGFPFARVAVVSDPGAIREVLVDKTADYAKSALERRILSARLRHGLVAVDDEQWRSQRRTLAPSFGRKMLLHFAPEMARAANSLVERWRGYAADEIVDIKSEMSRLALDVLVRCIFSDALGENRDAMCAAITRFFKTGGGFDPFDIVGLPDFVPRITQRRFRPILQPFDAALDAVIAAQRSKAPERLGGAAGNLLEIMLSAKDPETARQMSEVEVRANVLTFIFAGQETTSTALTWAIYLLSQSAEWRERVTAESQRLLDGAPEIALDRLVTTRAVINEALRLYPPIIGVTRTARRRSELAGHTIERGTMVIVSPYVLHRHRRLWDEPDLFDPGRFLETASRPIERFAFLPFGAGPRACIGAGFAMQELTLMLATIMKYFSPTPVPGQTIWPVQGFTLGIQNGLRATLRPH